MSLPFSVIVVVVVVATPRVLDHHEHDHPCVYVVETSTRILF